MLKTLSGVTPDRGNYIKYFNLCKSIYINELPPPPKKNRKNLFYLKFIFKFGQNTSNKIMYGCKNPY